MEAQRGLIKIIILFTFLLSNAYAHSQECNNFICGKWENAEKNQTLEFFEIENNKFEAKLVETSLEHLKPHLNEWVIRQAKEESDGFYTDAKVHIIKRDLWLNAYIKKVDNHTIVIGGKIGHFSKEFRWKRVE